RDDGTSAQAAIRHGGTIPGDTSATGPGRGGDQEHPPVRIGWATALGAKVAGGTGAQLERGRSTVSRRTDHTDTTSLENFLQPIVEQFGCDLEGADITPAGRRRLLRVLVDRDGGISLDDVAEVTR